MSGTEIILKVKKVRHHDPDLRRKGGVLAIILLGMTTAVFVLAIANVVEGDLRYNLTNSVLATLTVGLFLLNRLGFIYAASCLTVLLSCVGAFLLLPEDVAAAYLAMVLPILIASFLLVSWGGFVVAALIVISAVILDVNSLSLIVLVVVSIICYLFADSLEYAYHQIHYQAFHDHLTGLANRALFLDRLKQAIDRSYRNQTHVGVLFMDLDNFKVINDSLGHELGDQLLVQVGDRIQKGLRPGDTAARLGGDEFVILLDNINDVGDAIRITERITEQLQAPLIIQGHRIMVTVSTGITLSNTAYVKPINLLRDADVAMYQAKKTKAHYKVFHSRMHVQALKRLELERDLRQGIQGGDFGVVYQPKVLLDTGRIVEVEALVRWRTPERGIVMPLEFIPVAEETGLIISIGEQVLESACRQIREWHEQHESLLDLKMCVNLSVRQFQNFTLIDDISKVLQTTRVQASSLQLEITESMVMENERRGVHILRELKALGVRVSLDDFGKGYSSLNYLKDLPIDSLKIDKSFVDGLGKDPAASAIIRLIIELAHSLNLQVTAEGVQSAQQLERLLEMGCDLGQGYYFSKPLPADKIGALMAAELSH